LLAIRDSLKEFGAKVFALCRYYVVNISCTPSRDGGPDANMLGP